MKLDVTARSARGLLLCFGALVALACTKPGGLRTSAPADAGAERAAEVMSTPDMVWPGDLPSDLPVDRPLDVPAAPADALASLCGNGVVDPGEDCDNGNTRSDDGCSAECQVGPTWIPGCPPETGCLNRCGDGTLAAAEACDDGNITSGDGCSSDCTFVEPGFRCPTPGRPCTPISSGDGGTGPEAGRDMGTPVDEGVGLPCHTSEDCLGGTNLVCLFDTPITDCLSPKVGRCVARRNGNCVVLGPCACLLERLSCAAYPGTMCGSVLAGLWDGSTGTTFCLTCVPNLDAGPF